MKKAIILLSMILSVGCFCVGCGGDKASANANSAGANGEKTEAVNSTSSKYMSIDGLYLDNSYQDKDNDKIKMLYLFYTLSTDDINMSVDSAYTELTVNDTNTYESEMFKGVCKYMPNYYYSKYIEDLYVGDSIKVVATFEIPLGELSEGRKIALSDSDIPEIEKIVLSTDDITVCENVEEIAKAVDNEGYETALFNLTEADADTTAKVQSEVNGYYWDFYVNSTSYRMEFFSPNYYELTALGMTNSGTYTVANGYILATYESNGYTVEIPYEFGEEGFELDITKAFDVNE